MSSVVESTAEDEVYHSAEEGDGLEDKLDRLEVKSEGGSSKGQPIGGGRGEEGEQIHTDPESNEKVTEEAEQDSKKVELTEEQRKELIEKGDRLKKRGNEHYKVEGELANSCHGPANISTLFTHTTVVRNIMLFVCIYYSTQHENSFKYL